MSTKRALRKYVAEPVVYEVGKDLTQEQYQQAIERIGDWFSQVRNTKEPVLLAKQSLDRCLKGKTSEDRPWYAAATASLNKRVRAMCRFDLDTMTPIYSASEKNKKLREKSRAREKKRRIIEKENPLLTDEVRTEMKARGVNYGDNVRTFFTQAEEKRWRNLKSSYLQEFPHLQSVNASAELEQLCDLHILQERVRMDRVSGKRAVNPIDAAALVDELQKLKKALGIHPDQLKNKVQDKIDTTIGAAAQRLEGMGNYRELRARFFLEEALQLWQMYNTPKADGQGYQLDEPGLFALTRCRTCHCSTCKTRNYVGWTVDEIETMLKDRGIIAEVENASTEAAPPAGGAPDVGADDASGGVD